MRSSSGVHSSGQVRARATGERLTVPTSLTELVSARLAALPEEVREVLEPVALLGEPTVSIVEAVASDADDGARAPSHGARRRRSWS